MVKLLVIKKYIYYYNVLLLFKSFLSSFRFLFVLSWLIFSVLELIQTARARTNQSPWFRYMQRGYYKITTGIVQFTMLIILMYHTMNVNYNFRNLYCCLHITYNLFIKKIMKNQWQLVWLFYPANFLNLFQESYWCTDWSPTICRFIVEPLETFESRLGWREGRVNSFRS